MQHRIAPTLGFLGIYLSLASLGLAGCGDDAPEADLTDRVCSTTCDKVNTCFTTAPECVTACDGTVRPLLEVDASVPCATDAQIDACISAVNSATCFSFFGPNPIPAECNLCDIDFAAILTMALDGGVPGDGGASPGDAGAGDAGSAGDASVPEAGTDSGVPEAGTDSGVSEAGTDSGVADAGETGDGGSAPSE